MQIETVAENEQVAITAFDHGREVVYVLFSDDLSTSDWVAVVIALLRSISKRGKAGTKILGNG